MNRGWRASSSSASRTAFTTTARRRLGDEGLRPDHVADLGPGERPRPALHEQAQELVGLRLERDRLTRAKELPTLLVELEVPKEERHGPGL